MTMVVNEMTNEHSVTNTRLSAHQLKRVIDIEKFDFETTEQLAELTSIVGQERGTSVTKFGLHVDQEGYNLYVAGIAGTGKTSFTKSIVQEFAQKEVILYDWCYVHNFEDSYKPKVIQLSAGVEDTFNNR